MNTQPYTIDAKGKSIGRVASSAASILMGKTAPSFQKNAIANVAVTIENASKATFFPRKLNEVRVKSYSGYPGGLKEHTMAHVIEKKGYRELFIHAIGKMIPRNRLHKGRMKRLTVTD